MFSTVNISASGLTAQRLRMDLIADNIANVNTTRTEEGMPYRRKLAILRSKENSFIDNINSNIKKSDQAAGVEVAGIREDTTPFKTVYRPNHPDSDQDGYLQMPNISITTEMVDMIEASRSYEANVTALNITKRMALKALEIGRG